MKSKLSKLLFVILFCFFCTDSVVGQVAKTDFQSAELKYDLREYQNSLQILTNINRQIGNSNAVIEHLRVKCLFQLERFDEAEKSLHEFFKYKAADYLIDEMLEYAGKIRKKKIRLKKNEMTDTHSKLDEIVQKEEKIITDNISSINEEIERIKKELKDQASNKDKAAFEVALQTNTIESYNAYLENPNYSLYNDKALEKIEYLKFLEIVNSDKFDALASAYIENNPNDTYAKRLKLIMEFKHVKSIKLTGYLNGECLMKSQDTYIKVKSKEEAISIIEHCINLETLNVEGFHTSKPIQVDLSLLKHLEEIELDAYNPNVSYKNVNAIKTLKIQGSSDSKGYGYTGLQSHLKDFSHLTSLESLELLLLYNSDSSHIIEILSNNQNLIDLTINQVGTDYDGNDWIYNGYMDRAIEKVADLTKLKRLKVNKSVSTLPDNIGNLIELEELDLSENDIEILPNSIGELKKLRELNLRYNKFKNIPSSIGNLSKLEKLNLSLNNFSNLPAEFCNLTKLRSLEIGSYSLKSLPENFGNLKGLEELDISSSPKIYSLPESFSELVNLKKLNISSGTLEGNRAKEIKSSIKKLKKKNSNMVVIK